MIRSPGKYEFLSVVIVTDANVAEPTVIVVVVETVAAEAALPNVITEVPAAAPVQYNPVKAPKPLPAPTRAAVVQPNINPQEHINLPPDMDQRGRAMLPKSKRGPNIWDLVNMD